MVDVFRGVVKLMRRDRARAVKETARIDKALAALGYGGAGAGPRRVGVDWRFCDDTKSHSSSRRGRIAVGRTPERKPCSD